MTPAAVAATAAAALWALRPEPAATLVWTVAAAAAVAAVAWALADLEQFTLVAVLGAMTFPPALLHLGGALVAAADLLLLVALGAWLARGALRSGPPVWIAGNPLAVPALLFAAVTASSLVWTSDAAETAKASVQIAQIVVVVSLLYASVPASLGRIRQGLAAYVVLTSGLAAVTAGLFLANAASGELAPQYLGALHKNAVGSFLGVGLVLAYALSLDRTMPARTRRLFAGAAAVELAGLAATISRGSLLGGLLAVLAATALLRRARTRTVLLAGLAAAVFVVTIQVRVIEQTRAAGGYEPARVRLASYAHGIETIREHPLLGTGAGTYWAELPEFGRNFGLADPNNLFLLTWAELGLAGMAALLFLLFRYGRVLLRARLLPEEARVPAVAAGAAALSLLIHFQVDSTWTRGTATMCFALIGVLAAVTRLVPRPAGATPVPAVLDPPAEAAAAAVRPLRVLQVVSSEGFAGIERHVLRLARGLRDADVDCAIACPPAAARLRAAAESAGVPVVPATGGGSRAWFSEVLAAYAADPPDVVHAHDGAASVAAWRLAAPHRSRLVRTQHFVRPASSERSGWRRAASLALHRSLNSDVDALVAVSGSVAEAARARHEVAPAKIAVIPPGVELPPDVDVRRAVQARRRKKTPLVAYVGRLEPEKAPELLLCAVPLVLERLPECRFVVAGSGSLEPELRRVAEGMRLGRALEWAGAVDDAAPVLRRAHLLVSPSSREGFGLAVAEAMAWALPVVGVRAGGVAETVEDGVTGLLVDEADPSALAEAIARVAGDGELRERLGGAARAAAVERHGADRTVARTAALYERLARDR